MNSNKIKKKKIYKIIKTTTKKNYKYVFHHKKNE